MTEVSGVGNLQTLKLSSRATSKFKALEPTKLASLCEYYPDKYKELEEDLDTLSEGDLVKIVFVNKEELWIVVDSVDLASNADGETGIVFGKTCAQAMKLQGLQKGQRVKFDVACVVEIKYHTDDSSDEDDDDD